MSLRIACIAMVSAIALLVPVRSASARPVCDAPRIKYEVSKPKKSKLLTSAQGRWAHAGLEASLTRGRTAEVNASINASVTAEAGVIFAKASTELGVTVGGSWASETSETFSEKVPKGHEGRIVMYHDSLAFTVDKKQLDANCRYLTVARHRINAPIRSTAPVHDHVVMQLHKLAPPYTTTYSLKEVELKHRA